MKEITKTIIKKYDSTGKLLEHTETIVEKENVNYNLGQYLNPYTQQIPKWYGGIGGPCMTGK